MLNMLTGGGVSPTIKIDGCERERFSFFGILSFCLWFLSFVRLFAHSLALFFEMCFVAQQQRDGRSGGVLRKIDEWIDCETEPQKLSMCVSEKWSLLIFLYLFYTNNFASFYCFKIHIYCSYLATLPDSTEKFALARITHVSVRMCMCV